MTITINPDLLAYIDPLTEAEAAALERSLLEEGCRDALVLWGDVLVDGHNRYRICQQHGIPFQTVQNTRFRSIEDVHLWMIDNHLGRRSVSDYQRGVLALRRKAILSARPAAGHADDAGQRAVDTAHANTPDDANAPPWDTDPQAATGSDTVHSAAAAKALAGSAAGQPSSAVVPPPGASTPGSPGASRPAAPTASLNRAELARAARVSPATLGHIEKIQKQAAPALIGAVKSGVISINAAATVADLPVEQQAEAVAGGRRALRDTARQLREARKPARSAKPLPELPEDATPEARQIHALTLQVARLTEERDELRKKVQNLVVALSEARKHASDSSI